MSPRQSCDVVVVGAGPVGQVAALALAHQGLTVALAGPRRRSGEGGADLRTAALFAGSIELLRNLGVWHALASACEPIVAIRLIDATGGLLRGPEVLFRAEEIEADAFGYNVPNAALDAALADAVSRVGTHLLRVDTAGVAELSPSAASVLAKTSEGALIEARLAVAADGRRSLCREAAGIETSSWTYDQSAVVCSFSHQRPHGGISNEFHTRSGPITTVPLPGNASSLVWVERPGPARRLAALGDDTFKATLEAQLGGVLGPVRDVGRRAVFQLAGMTASVFGKNRVALVGEAGHVVPPIGAQGLNLGLRDAATLADCVGGRHRADPGTPEVLAAYSQARAGDVASRSWTLDLLNRSLLSDLLPVHLARGLGLVALKTLGPLRRMLMREGVQPRHVPSLMLPGAGPLGARQDRDGMRLPGL